MHGLKMVFKLFVLCFIVTSPVLSAVAADGRNEPSTTGNCTLPPFPDHGRYAVVGKPNASPGQAFYTAKLDFTCNPGYGIDGESTVYCVDGSWSLDKFPECVRFCKLKKDPSVEYRCNIPGIVGGTRPCNDQEPTGTVAKPVCNAPNYYSSGALNNMQCIDGVWDYQPICSLECGNITPEAQTLILVTPASRGKLPWHVAVYSKKTKPYIAICGGSLVSTNVVISAAHCFWDNVEHKAQPASMFAVAVGKLYRPWDDPRDVDAQKSDVKDIKIPSRFYGDATNFQDDISVLTLTTSFEYKLNVRPVCLDFEPMFERKQLNDGNLGKVARWEWGPTDKSGKALEAVELPYVGITECITSSPIDFREYITSDKFCTGHKNGSSLCRGDSGAGIAFPETVRGVERYYLRGVMSVAQPIDNNICNEYPLVGFTSVTKHDYFINEVLQKK